MFLALCLATTALAADFNVFTQKKAAIGNNAAMKTEKEPAELAGVQPQIHFDDPKKVRNSGKAHVSVTQPINPDQWNTIEASVRGTEAKLSVDGVEAKAKVPAPGMKPTQAYLRLGSYDDRRPFTGSIADLTVSEPAE